ncbi:MAG: CBS domain-containing protein [Desulfatiglans sp.]|jgi:acetoin utilization protein AcuB|nr:CBS domain-containing protein [Thermodesulfobacteriota bacterium]MEE4354732.1 CBS domain-containing protein [Desulfatiglans sp.]
MRVRDFMKKDVITVDINTPIMAALEIMKHNSIKRLPVIKNKKFAGLVTRAMIRDASPSEATSLSIHELNYLISKMTVGDIMVKNPISITPDHPVEEAIRIGKKHGLGAFPVLENGELVGIITQSDISEVVSDALGVWENESKRITIETSGKRFGFLRGLLEILDDYKIPLISVMTVMKADKKDWFLVLRVRSEDASVAVEDMKKKGYEVSDVS